jgi:hypothetical protein
MPRKVTKRLALAIVPVLALLMSARGAEAVPLIPGAPAVPPDAIVFTGAEVVLASVVRTWAANSNHTGEVRAAVLNEGAANPLGGLTFVYQLANSAASRDAIGRTTDFNFGLFLTHAHIAFNGSALGGAFTDGTQNVQSVDRSGDGNVVGWNFTGAGVPDAERLDPGETSLVMIIRTNAPDWDPGFTSVINGGTDDVDTFQPAPAAPIPEPAALLLFGTALAGLASLRRRRT